MAVVMIWDLIERLLGGIAITLGVISAILYFYRSRERKNQGEWLIIFGFGILICGATVLLTFYYFLQFSLPGYFSDFTFYIDNSVIDLNYHIRERLGWLIFFIIFTLYVFVHERIVLKRTKYGFTIIIMVFIVLMSFTLPYDLFNILQTLCYGFIGLIITLLLIIMTRMSKIEFKAVTAFLLAAVTLISLSIRFLALPFKELGIIPLFVPQLIIIIGWILSIMPILIKPSRLTRANYYWIGSVISIMAYLLFAFILYILSGEIIKLVTLIINAIIFLYAGFDALKSIKSVSLEKFSPEFKTDQHTVLEVFTRPQLITEEEITVSKEKRVCLVCKVKLERSMFICPDCATFYCKKCSDTLKDLENACWVCNAPFDELKPSKPFKYDEKEEKIEISGKIKDDLHTQKDHESKV